MRNPGLDKIQRLPPASLTAEIDAIGIFRQPRPNDRSWPKNEPASREGGRGEGLT